MAMFGITTGSFVAVGVMITGQLLQAEHSTPESSEKPTEKRNSVMRRYIELSRKVNANPEIASLKSQAEEARQNYQKAFEAEMEKEDSEILGQYRSVRESSFRTVRDPTGDRDLKIQQRVSNIYDQLSDTEKKQLDTARREAMHFPAVKEARLKRNQAKNEDDRTKATAAYRETLHKAMTEVDEGVQNLLKKLERKE